LTSHVILSCSFRPVQHCVTILLDTWPNWTFSFMGSTSNRMCCICSSKKVV